MKTNIELVNNAYATPIGVAEFCAGITEEGEYLVELCDIYRALDGSQFGYCHILKQVIEDHGPVYPLSAITFGKRGRHSYSNNKKRYAMKVAEMRYCANPLPF